jgi:hypothetical protein
MKAKYCKCKNTYTINKCDRVYGCENPQLYFRQEIGDICATNANYLTAEDGEYLTTEDGFKITT